MGRPLNWNNLAVIISTIQKNPTKWKDLRELGKGIPEKTLQRYLTEYLGENGVNLVKKKGEFWVWTGYEYPREYTPQEYDIAVKHARSLMPAIESLLEHEPTSLLDFREKPQPERFQIWETEIIPKAKIEQIEKYRLSEYLEEHLETGYLMTYGYLLSFRKYFLLQDAKAPLALVFEDEAKKLSKKMGRKPQTLSFIDKQEEKIFLDYKAHQYRMLRYYQLLNVGLQRIKMSVESGGNPLKGHCKICPNVIIKDE